MERMPRVFALAVLVVLAAAPAASGWSVRIARTPASPAPALAGGSVVWADEARGRVRVRSAVRGGPRRVIARLPGHRGYDESRARLAASPQLVGAEQIFTSVGERESVDFVATEVFSGPAAGPPTRQSPRCGVEVYVGKLFRTVDVSGSEVFYWDCERQSGVVHDVRTGATESIPGVFDRGLRLAGRYAAWNDPHRGAREGSVVVYDRAARAVAYEVEIPPEVGSLVDLDLQDDGTVVMAYGGDVAWATDAEPFAHTVSLPVATYGVRIANDRIGFARLWPMSDDEATTELGYISLDGVREHVVASGAVSAHDFDAGIGDFDFDGRRFAWHSYACRSTLLRVTSLGRRVDGFNRHCRLRFERRPLVRGRRVVMRIDCAFFQYDTCRARDVRVRLGRRLVASGRTSRAVRLTPRGRKLLRRTRRVRVVATLRDDAGRKERRTARIRLRR